LRIVLTVISSLFLFTGCISFGDKDPANIDWAYPDKPNTEKVDFEKVLDGYFLNKEEMEKLTKNVEELKAYSLKLEKLIERMKEHYEK
jgi:hypothetical protein